MIYVLYVLNIDFTYLRLELEERQPKRLTTSLNFESALEYLHSFTTCLTESFERVHPKSECFVIVLTNLLWSFYSLWLS